MEPATRRPTSRPCALRPSWAAVLLIPALAGCRQPAVRGPEAYAVRLYDLHDARRLACDLTPSGLDGAQGTAQARVPGGESFQGEWTRLAWQRTASAGNGDGKYPSSLPVLPAQANPLEATWGWAADLGIDFSRFPSSYWSFFLYGSGGTRISGFFLDRSATLDPGVGTRVRQLFQRQAAPRQAHLLGAARDNLGHRYKLIGNSTEGTMEITSTRPASRPAAAAPAGTAARSGATGRTAKEKPAQGGATAFQERLDKETQAPAAAGKEPSATRDPVKVSAQATAEASATVEGGVSPVKVFAYGALGVDAPEGETQDQKDEYRAGQWTGAAAKVGGIIALLA